jgi:hypothetical protein
MLQKFARGIGVEMVWVCWKEQRLVMFLLRRIVSFLDGFPQALP